MALCILAPLSAKMENVIIADNALSIGGVYVFADKRLKYVVPKLTIDADTL